MRSNLKHGRCSLQIRDVVWIEFSFFTRIDKEQSVDEKATTNDNHFQNTEVATVLPTCGNGQSRVNAIAPLVCTDSVPLRGVTNGANDRSSNLRIGMRPSNWNWVDSESICVCRNRNVFACCKLRGWDPVVCWLKREEEKR